MEKDNLRNKERRRKLAFEYRKKISKNIGHYEFQKIKNLKN